ncbi:hypothetical protein JDV02_003734 [Purpureocillium takamizusanense]|uniref:Uncharacterized protein n=1 Tax=Purpureocillium takamizusanense TaxID=2060973 RepID=A0A9Q8QES1_9HYPO|nr:uncharacterized protein JDV02_003734 [Purpureocillium takamizusanense]UNI17392.1 hypothetical protein JDV02_003734 [Purpureocillium takamizusanense]
MYEMTPSRKKERITSSAVVKPAQHFTTASRPMDDPIVPPLFPRDVALHHQTYQTLSHWEPDHSFFYTHAGGSEGDLENTAGLQFTGVGGGGRAMEGKKRRMQRRDQARDRGKAKRSLYLFI